MSYICIFFAEGSDLFTIKYHHAGEFRVNPTRYIGGTVDYFDLCDVDTMSLIELGSMAKETGEVGALNFFYKWPKTDMNRGLHPIDNDADVVEMCELLPPSRVIHLYSITIIAILAVGPDGNPTEEYRPTQDYAPSQDPNIEYVDGHGEAVEEGNPLGDVDDVERGEAHNLNDIVE